MTGRAARGIALSLLMSAIHREAEDGESIPCLDIERSYLWLSDDPDNQEAAAYGCSNCPALLACKTYIGQHAEPSGVWAGKRPSRTDALPKELR